MTPPFPTGMFLLETLSAMFLPIANVAAALRLELLATVLFLILIALPSQLLKRRQDLI